MYDLEVFSKTDIGLVRTENQDSSAYSVISSDCAWAVVCDGMGGANGGKTASSAAVNYISEFINREFKEDMDDESLSEMLISAVDGANLCVYKMSMENYELAGMGTTCDLVFVRGEVAHVVHVGDSRTYSIRDGKILQITEDHSLVQEMVRRGELTPDQAMNHPNKNLITRALGISHEVHIDYIEAEFSEGDVLLICSDGLSNYVSKADMVRTVKEHKGELLIDTLVEIAKRHGGHDNITVTVVY
ncbi:Stp1/IreP family PP2C-type Ser/Thr phosphatase [uncultured Ruminococcus sp.]|uniref:Stp1/IreP family PP2C-type Ser/Thr phosphatase n=1 Tax=uncultured Ruminococcus sp. TaxID=165186 RepID=UPI0029308F63|nr:Stp1/IreP family PP2C-type Ser/Thr phosphatase [uncultured Ruminococcus sp.]